MLPRGPRISRVRQTLRWHYRPTEVLSDAAAKYGTPFTLRLLGRPPAVILSDPDHVRAVFKSSPELLLTGAPNRGFRTHIGPHTLFGLDGADHRRHRRILNPAFHESRAGASTAAVWTRTVAMVERWSVGDEVRLLDAMYALAFDLILDTVFGISDPSLLARLRQLAAILARETSPVLMFLPFSRWDLGPFSRRGRYVQALGQWDRILYDEIDRALAGSEERSDILGVIARQGETASSQLSRTEIRDELMTLLVAGHATTAIALTWLFQSVLASADVTRRVREEIRDQLGRGFQPESLDQLTFVDAVILENLRLHPPVLLVLRQLASSASIAGFDLPGGTLVRPCPYLTHRDPRIFPDPEVFRPERFLGGRPSPYEYYPFGGGHRACVGASHALHQMRVMFAAVMAHVDLQLLRPSTSDVSRFALLVAPAHGTPVRVERRLLTGSPSIPGPLESAPS